MRLRRLTLASRILVAVLGIVVVTMGIGLALYVSVARDTADTNATDRAADIATTVGDMPSVAAALEAGDPGGQIRRVADRVVHDTGASYVVVIGADGVRYSHPNPALIGKRVEEPVVALDGRTHTGVDNGSLGRSANARAPIRDAAGKPIGEVSVGILETQVAAGLNQVLVAVALYTVLALAVGVIASLVLARTIKRVTFGLEPAEIVALMQEREAMLHGIREGVIGFDAQGRTNVVNDEARRLLGRSGVELGQPVEDLAPPGRLRDILSGAVTGSDEIAVTDSHLLVLNRMPVVVAGRSAGWVVTIRDRTELEALLRQLDSVEGLTTALRAQEHEFSNRLHALSVLLELGEVDEATLYAGQLRARSTDTGDDVRARIGPPVVAALLLAKMTVAAERDVQVVLHPDSRLATGQRDHTTLLTVLGNLVDNAIDAVADAPGDGPAYGGDPGDRAGDGPEDVRGDGPAYGGAHRHGTVTVELSGDDDEIRLSVTDTGPGIAPEHLEQVFVDGFSTKAPRGALRRGVGLALVHRLVLRAGGAITVTSGNGARFDVRLPVHQMERTS